MYARTHSAYAGAHHLGETLKNGFLQGKGRCNVRIYYRNYSPLSQSGKTNCSVRTQKVVKQTKGAKEKETSHLILRLEIKIKIGRQFELSRKKIWLTFLQLHCLSGSSPFCSVQLRGIHMDIIMSVSLFKCERNILQFYCLKQNSPKILPNDLSESYKFGTQSQDTKDRKLRYVRSRYSMTESKFSITIVSYLFS